MLGYADHYCRDSDDDNSGDSNHNCCHPGIDYQVCHLGLAHHVVVLDGDKDALAITADDDLPWAVSTMGLGPRLALESWMVMIGTVACPMENPLGFIPCRLLVSTPRAKQGTRVATPVDGEFDFEHSCSLSSVTTWGTDPMLEEAVLGMPALASQPGAPVVEPCSHSIHFYPRVHGPTHNSSRGTARRALDAEFDLVSASTLATHARLSPGPACLDSV